MAAFSKKKKKRWVGVIEHLCTKEVPLDRFMSAECTHRHTHRHTHTHTEVQLKQTVKSMCPRRVLVIRRWT